MTLISCPEPFRHWYAKHRRHVDAKNAHKNFPDLMDQFESCDDEMGELIEDIQNRIDRVLATTKKVALKTNA